MRVSIRRVHLLGTDRTVEFRGGLNIVIGPIATGKTTLVTLLRFLLGGKLGSLPPETKATVNAISGSVLLPDGSYSIVRPAVTTSTAKVDIASDHGTWRLPASSADRGDTYLSWLLDRLSLPRLKVPSAPSHPESGATPVSIRDYWMYSYLSQKEIGFEIFGHKDYQKNVKRKYVFDIVYGFYDVHTAELHDRLRSVTNRLNHLRSQAELFKNFFENTPLENRAVLDHKLTVVREHLSRVEADTAALAAESDQTEGTADLQRHVLHLEREVEKARAAAAAESTGLTNIRELIAQLESQSAKLTRAIVAGKHLTDIDFILCPRCGSSVEDGRGTDPNACYLCLQDPTLDFSRDVLIKEQESVESQLVESQDLLRERRSGIKQLHERQRTLEEELGRARADLDFHTRTFVSERARQIADAAGRRSALRVRESQLQEYVDVLAKLDDSQKRQAELSVQRDQILQELDTVETAGKEARDRVTHLEARFNDILERFWPPEFGEEQSSSIDHDTYLPIYRGRRFDILSSPGLSTLVGLAYSLVHHVTAIELGLRLPGFLIVDGLSEHLGEEGLDPDRLEAVYEYLIALSHRLGDRLQVIVVDNEVPASARPFIRLELSETDRLIPQSILEA